MKHLFCFGLGYSARALALRLATQGWKISGTRRDVAGREAIRELGYDGYVFTGEAAGEGVAAALKSATHVLTSAAPDTLGDPVLRHHIKDLAAAASIEWIGYLSTIGVYGDFGGAWIDETAELNPASKRGQRRVDAEAEWRRHGEATICDAMGDMATRDTATRDTATRDTATRDTATRDTATRDLATGQAVQVFRLAGIYGPGRSTITKLRNGTARRIAKPGQVFNRIHVEDVAGAVIASIETPEPGGIYNVVDDEPMPPQDVIAYVAGLIGMDPPPELAFDTADMTDMARSFYGESKRVSNARLKQRLGYVFRHPTFREGFQALVDNGE